MIIEALMSVVFLLFELLTLPISIVALPERVSDIVFFALEYISFGVALLANYVDVGYLFSLFTVVLAADTGILIYKFVVWIMKKIPMVGIE